MCWKETDGDRSSLLYVKRGIGGGGGGRESWKETGDAIVIILAAAVVRLGQRHSSIATGAMLNESIMKIRVDGGVP